MPPRPSVSILILTHNRAAVLAQALESLALIRLPEGVPVELIVVANACTDDTCAVVESRIPSLPFPARLVVEPRPGLNIARNRAAAEARHDIFAFLDDDVWLDPQWLVELVALYRDHGAQLLGGRIELWWQAVERPAWFSDAWLPMLSGLDLGRENTPLHEPNVFGANFSVSREVFERVGPFHPDLDRKGTRLLGGGDSKLVGDALAAGFTLFYAGRSSVKHWVMPERATARYLARVTRGSSTSLVLMRSPFTAKYALRTLVIATARLALHTPPMLAAMALRLPRPRARHGIGVAAGLGALEGLAMRLRRGDVAGAGARTGATAPPKPAPTTPPAIAPASPEPSHP